MSGRQVWILAGGNGAGKSTFYRQRLKSRGLDFINADVIAKNVSPDNPEDRSYVAASAARSLFRQYVNEGRSFCYETVFSHESKIAFVEIAKKAGYRVVLVYFHLADGLHPLRVEQRVSEGGHAVPTDKILTRTLKNVTQAAPIAMELIVFDNSSIEQPFQLLAHRKGDVLVFSVDSLPIWCEQLLDPAHDEDSEALAGYFTQLGRLTTTFIRTLVPWGDFVRPSIRGHDTLQ